LRIFIGFSFGTGVLVVAINEDEWIMIWLGLGKSGWLVCGLVGEENGIDRLDLRGLRWCGFVSRDGSGKSYFEASSSVLDRLSKESYC